MPFNQPFNWNFTDGDLIYGLAPSRRSLVIHFGATILNIKGPSTVDQYRRGQMSTLRKQDRTAWRSFLRENEAHKRYGRYVEAIRAYNNDEEKFAEANQNAAVQNAAWRAKSKFGMEWTLKNQRGHIHFVLDAIDMAAVVTKTHEFTDPHGIVLAHDLPRGKAPTGVDKERTITHSELRWVYRNRSNPLVQARVQFWITAGNIHPCGPPWENNVTTTTMPSGAVITWRRAWQAYNPTQERNAF
jgi:hypothetical protein